ncbi:MAG: NAD-dependent epimerase/dehydratase family protein, partial [Candidatus Binatia bacterium]
MNVLVTGATGPFGRAVCRHLLAGGHAVVAMARRSSASLPAGVAFVAGDVRDAARVTSAVKGCDAVVHLAWVVSPLKSRDETRDINLGGTRN